MTADEFKAKYKVGGTTSGSVPTQSVDGKSGANLPMGGGIPQDIAGAIGQMIGEPIGAAATIPTGGIVNPVDTSMALSGLFQGGAQAGMNLLQGQPIGQGVAPQAGEGAVMGAMPGGPESKVGTDIAEMGAKQGVKQFGKQLIKQAPKRAAVGAGIGGASQLVGNAFSGQGDLLNNVPQTALLTGLANAVTPAISKGAGKLASGIKNIPGDVYGRTVGGPIQLLQNLYNQAAEKAVGMGNVPYALEKGILPSAKNENGVTSPEGLIGGNPEVEDSSNMIDEALLQTSKHSSTTYNALQKELGKIDHKIPSSQISGTVSQYLAGTAGTGMRAKNIMSSFLNKIQPYLKAEGGNSAENITKSLRQGDDIDLRTLNTVKQAVGHFYQQGEASPWNDLYHHFKNYIEVASGKNGKVGNLNNELKQLRDIRESLNKWKKPGVQSPISPQDSADRVQSARWGEVHGGLGGFERSMPPSFQMIKALTSLLAGGAGWGLMGGLTKDMVGSTGGGWLAMSASERLANKLLDNPDIQENLAKLAPGLAKGTENVGNLLQKLGVRLPETADQQAQQQTQQQF